jgi:hypothetical protein
MSFRILSLLKCISKYSEELNLNLIDPIPSSISLLPDEYQKTTKKFLINFTNLVINYNSIGPVVFVCPELGKWTTAGGLGYLFIYLF